MIMTTDGNQNNTGKLMMTFDEEPTKGAKIKVVGVGGGGGNAVNRMIEAGVQGVEFIVANTDVQALNKSNAPLKIQLGTKLTRGLGAGSNPETGRSAALEDYEKILNALEGADMVFVTTGLGGGTGTGAAPVIASLAMELGALTVAVVTKPFDVEGKRRMAQAERGLAELRGCVDTIITIPNTKLYEVEENIGFLNAFNRANDILTEAVQGISELITVSGLINVDFADVTAVIEGMGVALMGIGRAKGEGAAVKAMKAALESKLLEADSITGAKGALINFSCSSEIPLNDLREALGIINEEADEDATIIFGIVNTEEIEDEVKVTVIATGFDSDVQNMQPIYLPDDLQPTNTPPPSAPPPNGSGPLGSKKDDDEDMEIPTFIRRQAD